MPILEERVVEIDFDRKVDAVVARLAAAGHHNAVGHGNSDRALDSYAWSLGRLLAEVRGPWFDYVYLDGAHTWCHDALAFLLCIFLLILTNIVAWG